MHSHLAPPDRFSRLAGVFVAILYAVAFLTPQPMPVVGGVVALSLFSWSWARSGRPDLPRGLVVALSLFIAWGLMSAVWSLDSGITLKKSAQLFGTALMAVLLVATANALPEQARATMRRCALWGGAALVAATAVEGYGGLPWRSLVAALGWSDHALPHTLNRTTLIMVLLSWPAAMAAIRLARPGWAAVLVLAAAVVPLGLDSGTAVLAAAGGLVTAATAWVASRLIGATTPRLLAAVFVPGAAGALYLASRAYQWIANDAVPVSLHHRFHIWEFAVRHGMEKALTGWGLGISRAMPNFGEEPIFTGPGTDIIPLHTHNTYVQVFMETGFVGFALFTLGTAFMIAATRHWARTDQVCAAGVFGAVAASWLTGYGAWQSWWLASLALLGFLMVALRQRATA